MNLAPKIHGSSYSIFLNGRFSTNLKGMWSGFISRSYAPRYGPIEEAYKSVGGPPLGGPPRSTSSDHNEVLPTMGLLQHEQVRAKT